MALRGWVGSRYGARVGYLLWALVPIAQLAVLLPARVGTAGAIPVRAQLAMAQTPAAEVAAFGGDEAGAAVGGCVVRGRLPASPVTVPYFARSISPAKRSKM